MRTVEVVGPRGGRWRCDVPTTGRERARGLLGRSIGADEALLLERCTSVHTVGMREAITVARLSKSLAVRDVRVMRPNRVLLPAWHRGHVLECAPGADLRVGDVLTVEPVPVGRGDRRDPPAVDDRPWPTAPGG